MGKAVGSKGSAGGKSVQHVGLKPDVSERVKVTTRRVTGRLLEWKGTCGWILPDSRIDHPLATKRGGKIYLAQEDVEQDLVNENVSFFVYADSSGLGARNCIPAKGPAAAAVQVRQDVSPAAGGKGKKGGGKGKTGGKGQKDGKGKGEKGEKGPSGPDLERERVTDMPVTGSVVSWRGKFGWVKAVEAIDHPKAEKHGGKLYAHQQDLLDGSESLEVGQGVQFHVYADASGLGAEEIELAEGVELEVDQNVQSDAGGLGEEDATPSGKTRTRGGRSKKVGKAKEGGKAKDGGKGKEGGKGKDGKGKGPAGPDLERERVTDMPVTGEVVSWRGKNGWLKPTVEVDHPKADKHGGKLYAHQKDLQEGTESLEAGQNVLFHVYADASGLGAEEIELF